MIRLIIATSSLSRFIFNTTVHLIPKKISNLPIAWLDRCLGLPAVLALPVLNELFLLISFLYHNVLQFVKQQYLFIFLKAMSYCHSSCVTCMYIKSPNQCYLL